MKGFKRKFMASIVAGLMAMASVRAGGNEPVANVEPTVTKQLKLGAALSYIKSCVAHMAVLVYYDSLDKELPELMCTKCKQRTLEYAKLSGIIEGRGLQIITEENGDGSHMQRVLDESTKLLKDGSFDALKAFMLRVANDIYQCDKCEVAAWGPQA